ncbi:protein FAM210B, mitochondrial [Tiliqua scincoides]|uniref:protein FAM210B, mitochondrial n=1 Tax=Tiliqua scincoides TaxID=71010 RepID=UPI0034628068
MPWLGQPCALHARLAEGLLLQLAAARVSLARGAAPCVGSSPAEARPLSTGVWLLSGQVQQAARGGHHPPARLWHRRGSQRWLHHLSRGSLLPGALAASSTRLPEPRCRQDRLLLPPLWLPLQQPEREAAQRAHQLLSKITLQATGSGLGPGGGGGGSGSSSTARAHKDVSGSPENEPADHNKENGKKPSKSQQLKKVFKEYGTVGVAFHVGISLMSLGMFYLAVSSGVDIAAILFKLGFDEALVQSKLAAGTSAFVLAYAIHKLFAPVRISITLVSVPLLVRYFRKIGFFKPPAPKP